MCLILLLQITINCNVKLKTIAIHLRRAGQRNFCNIVEQLGRQYCH